MKISCETITKLLRHLDVKQYTSGLHHMQIAKAEAGKKAHLYSLSRILGFRMFDC